jgi:hypothetical protein
MELEAVRQGATEFVDENVGTIVDRLKNAFELVDQCEEKASERAELVAKMEEELHNMGLIIRILKPAEETPHVT